MFHRADIIWTGALTDPFSMADAGTHIYFYQHTEYEVLHLSSNFPTLIESWETDFEAKGDWEFLDIPPSREIDVRSCSWVGFNVLGDNCI